MAGHPRRTVRLIGVPTDINSSFLRGPAKAPACIRAALFSDHGNTSTENGLAFGDDITLHDSGDLPLTENTLADDALIAAAVTDAADAGDVPFCLGGDHAVTFPIVAALAKLHGPLTLLHFDAHPDTYENFANNPRSHASPFARILEAGAARRLVQVGIRTMTAHGRAQAAKYDIEVIPMTDFQATLVPVLDGPLYISVDLDGLDPSAAPGVSHHEPGGLTVREILAVLARQTAHIVGADIVELNPDRDINGITAVVAAKLLKEICALPGAA
jgi:arginase